MSETSFLYFLLLPYQLNEYKPKLDSVTNNGTIDTLEFHWFVRDRTQTKESQDVRFPRYIKLSIQCHYYDIDWDELHRRLGWEVKPVSGPQDCKGEDIWMTKNITEKSTLRNTASLDRIDSSKHYTENNVQ